MGKWLRRLIVAVAVLAPAYYVLVVHSPAKGDAFTLDLPRIRELAAAQPGARPAEVRYEHVASLTFSEAMIMAGEPWRKSPMTVYAYQVVYPSQTLIIDTAMARSIAQPDFMLGMFDEAAYTRLTAAMDKATQIVITHEHMDHIGGITSHPRLGDLRPALRLTAEQLDNPGGMKPAVMPADALTGYEPLRYEGLHALAPGVVLVKAPGHTPGSQMVYVQLADGRELLFLGDVSWRQRNVEKQRERPLFMTLLIGEDRGAVLGQFAALNELMRTQPQVRQVPGHDGPAVQELAD